MPRLLSPAARALILNEEGVDQPSVWPGESSGVTIGIGYDLGYVTREEFAADWQASLTGEQFARLAAVVGLKGEAARSAARDMKGIVISRGQAIAIFDIHDVPKYCELTAATVPNSEELPADAFGALVSLVFNRGGSMLGDRRKEMRVIRDVCAAYGPVRQMTPKCLVSVLQAIAANLRLMRRLWPATSGLFTRREHEAVLVESCLPK